MALTQLAPPYPIFTDKNGDPLDAGYLYFGVVDLNPETNPIQVYWDNALTQPAAQPIRTVNGYPSRNGSPAAIYTNDYFSVTVRNKSNELVIYAPSGYGVTPGTSASLADQITYNEGSAGAIDRVLTARLQDHVSVKDFGAVGDGVTDDTVAIQAAAATGKPISLVDGEYLITSTISLTNDVYGPGKIKNNAVMFSAAADDIIVDGVEFEGTATSGSFAPIAVSAINRSKITVRNCTLTNCRVTIRNQALSRQTDFRFQNNTVNADFTLIEHIVSQNDVVTVRGIDGVWITDNNFTILNVHRVLKIADTEAATTSGTAFRARNVFVTGNRIVGSTDSGKQVMDLFSFTSDITVSDNMIDVSGFGVIVENKTGLAQNYEQNTFVTGNKLSNNFACLEFQGSYGATTPGYDVGYQNLLIEGNSIISQASSLSVLIYPISVRFYDDVRIIGNNIVAPLIFSQTTGSAAILVTSNAHATVASNTISNGAITFTSATTNESAEPFSSNILSIVCTGNTVQNFGGTGSIGGIQVSTIGATATNLRVLVEGNYVKQDVDDGASAGCIASNNSTFHTFAVQNNIGVMANPVEQRLRILSSTIDEVIESGNSWNQIGRASVTYDPPSIPAGGIDTTTITVTGAAVSTDEVTELRFSRALGSIILTAWVSAADTVTVQFYNPTGGSLDLASGTLAVAVTRKTLV